MAPLLQGYRLCAATEGKSLNSIAIVTCSVNYFLDFPYHTAPVPTPPMHGKVTNTAALKRGDLNF
jgi:hypothetical protein